jgi:uncharacterized Ntn-hydrolase superfamily protein
MKRGWIVAAIAVATAGLGSLGAAGIAAAIGIDPPLCATFSIVARDTTTGEFGVAVQSHWFAVGTTVPWAEAGVGAVATQSFVEPAYGPHLLSRMRAGETATKALVEESDADTLRAVRQVIVIDGHGNAGALTGEACIPYCGQHVGRYHVCAGNLLSADKGWDRMSEAYLATAGRPLGERLLAALDAGEKSGGDSRGMQSAAMIIVRVVDPQKPWKNRVVDLRVDDNPAPIEELRRLYTIQRAYAFADQGDDAFAHKDYAAALKLYDAGVQLVPTNDELIFWRGSMKMGIGDAEGAAIDCGQAIRMNPRWGVLIARLPDSVFPGVETVCGRLGIARH